MEAMTSDEIAELEALSQVHMASISQHARRDHLIYKATNTLRQAAAGAWRTIESAPKDGTPITGARTIRYLPYKPDGQRQMKAPGRWQEWNGYGWINCDDEPVRWMVPSPPTQQGG